LAIQVVREKAEMAGVSISNGQSKPRASFPAGLLQPLVVMTELAWVTGGLSSSLQGVLEPLIASGFLLQHRLKPTADLNGATHHPLHIVGARDK